MGTAEAARAIEPLAVLWCIPGFLQDSGPTRSGCCAVGPARSHVAAGANFPDDRHTRIDPPAVARRAAPTPAQLRAIEAPPGPVLVVAGPGAGKTFCLIARIGYLIARHGLEPRRICAVTFTNKAADEIAERLAPQLGPGRGRDHPRHAARALPRDPPGARRRPSGLRRGFGMADEEYQRRVLRRLRVRPERIGQLLRLFGRHRLQHYPAHPGRPGALRAGTARRSGRASCVDYNDLIALTGELLREPPRGRGRASARRWDCRAGGRVPGPEPGAVRGRHRARRAAPPLLRGGRRRAVHLLLGRRRPRILERFRSDFGVDRPDRPRPESPLLPADLRGRPPAHRRGIPALFEKQLEADRESEHCVEAYAFDDEVEEAELAPRRSVARPRGHRARLGRVRAAVPRPRRPASTWRPGCIEAGIPCRLAQGQALRDDEVIAFVVVLAPGDPRAGRSARGRGASPSRCCRGR